MALSAMRRMLVVPPLALLVSGGVLLGTLYWATNRQLTSWMHRALAQAANARVELASAEFARARLIAQVLAVQAQGVVGGTADVAQARRQLGMRLALGWGHLTSIPDLLGVSIVDASPDAWILQGVAVPADLAEEALREGVAAAQIHGEAAIVAAAPIHRTQGTSEVIAHVLIVLSIQQLARHFLTDFGFGPYLLKGLLGEDHGELVWLIPPSTGWKPTLPPDIFSTEDPQRTYRAGNGDLGLFTPLPHLHIAVVVSVDPSRFYQHHATLQRTATVLLSAWLLGASVVLFLILHQQWRTAKRQTATLAENERMFRAMFERMAVPKAQLDAVTGQYVRVNDAFARLTGYAPAELLQRRAVDLTVPEDRELDEQYLLPHLRGEKESYDCEKRILTKDGTRTWVHVYSSLIRTAEGRPERTSAIIIDVTPWKQLEAQLRYEDARLRAILEDMPAGVVIAEGDGRIWFANHRANALAPPQPGSATVDAYVHLDVRSPEGAVVPPSQYPMSRALRGETLTGVELRQRHPSQGEVILSVNAMPLRGMDGRITGAVVAFIDITARKHHEERLKQANQDLEQFASLASHDLREPLRMVASYLGLLEHRLDLHLDEQSRHYLRFAVDGAQRMQRFITHLLDFSHIDRSPPSREPFESMTAFATAVHDLGERLRETHGEVTHGTLPRITGDPELITRLFQNLIGNALKYHRPGVPPVVHVDAERNPEDPAWWRFRVADNGRGIPERELERIFHLFQRLDQRSDVEGFGIGLAMCRKIVERHGGRIWATSVVGEGSSFFMTLPA